MPYKIVKFTKRDEADTLTAAINYLAILAYPKVTNQHKNFRAKFYNACRAWCIKGPEGNMHAKGIYKEEILEFGRDARMYNTLEKVQNIIIDKRQVAANIKFKQLLKTLKLNNKVIVSRELIKAKNIASIADPKVAIDNARTRIWKDSLPVIHLMLGLLEAVGDMKYSKNITLFELIVSPEWVWQAIETSENIRQTLINSKDPRLLIKDKDTIQIFK